jgi:colanic acid/amylovoran biosynthesis glycosyltransferase
VLTIAYLTNRFPSPVEPYVPDEIAEFQKRGVRVQPCSVLRPGEATTDAAGQDVFYLLPPGAWSIARTTWLWMLQFWRLRAIWLRVLRGPESLFRKLKTLPHAWLGARLALRLRGCHIEHIHVHHGYFSSWVAMVAAQLLGISFSMTLHGSDLLLHDAYLNLKLENCAFCVTISEFNRKFILRRFAHIPPEKLVLQRMGVDCPSMPAGTPPAKSVASCFRLLCVGRLQAVKNHAFLIRACRLLKDRGLNFSCDLAGDGPERCELERLIRKLDLAAEVRLLGHIPRAKLDGLYERADLVVLTSLSEGIPLVLMEAMAHGKPVLAPAITGIPELIADGQNGFLFSSGCLDAFVSQIETIRDTYSALGPLRHAARQRVIEKFNHKKNLAAFCDEFLARLNHYEEKQKREDPVLQQI